MIDFEKKPELISLIHSADGITVNIREVPSWEKEKKAKGVTFFEVYADDGENYNGISLYAENLDNAKELATRAFSFMKDIQGLVYCPKDITL